MAWQTQNVGYIIPVPVIQHVLEDVARHGVAKPFGRLGFFFETLENKHLKAYLKLPPGTGGIMVTRVVPVSALAGQLQPEDVVTALDGHAIADDGTVLFRAEERIAFGYLLTNKYLGDPVTLTVWRKGKKIDVVTPLEDVPDLVPHSLYEHKPSYLVHAGLVFTPLTEPYLANTYTREWEIKAPVRLVHTAYHGVPEREGQQVILLAAILAHPLNVGFEPDEFATLPLVAVDGRKIINMATLVEAVRDAKDPIIRFELADSKIIVLPREEAHAATAEVLKTHAISSAVSEDLAAIAAGKAATALVPAGASTASKSASVAAPAATKKGKPSAGGAAVGAHSASSAASPSAASSSAAAAHRAGGATAAADDGPARKKQRLPAANGGAGKADR